VTFFADDVDVDGDPDAAATTAVSAAATAAKISKGDFVSEKDKEAAMTPEQRTAYRRAKKAAEKAEKKKGWQNPEDAANRNVYVTNLPVDITEEEFAVGSIGCFCIVKQLFCRS
jgi:hypothetical protein